MQQSKVEHSPYYNLIDTLKIVTLGQLCGDAQVLAQQVNDYHIKTHILYNSGMGDIAMTGANSTTLKSLHAPIFYMSGGKSDIVTSNAIKDFNRIKPISAVLAHTTAGHTGALDEPQGGSYTRLSFAWLDWQVIRLTAKYLLTNGAINFQNLQ